MYIVRLEFACILAAPKCNTPHSSLCCDSLFSFSFERKCPQDFLSFVSTLFYSPFLFLFCKQATLFLQMLIAAGSPSFFTDQEPLALSNEVSIKKWWGWFWKIGLEMEDFLCANFLREFMFSTTPVDFLIRTYNSYFN